jgi:hypothetical protein
VKKECTGKGLRLSTKGTHLISSHHIPAPIEKKSLYNYIYIPILLLVTTVFLSKEPK